VRYDRGRLIRPDHPTGRYFRWTDWHVQKGTVFYGPFSDEIAAIHWILDNPYDSHDAWRDLNYLIYDVGVAYYRVISPENPQ
jgi:hypothetical protein